MILDRPRQHQLLVQAVEASSALFERAIREADRCLELWTEAVAACSPKIVRMAEEAIAEANATRRKREIAYYAALRAYYQHMQRGN